MFFSQKKKYAQPVDEYNRSKENCRRQIILKAGAGFQDAIPKAIAYLIVIEGHTGIGKLY